MGAGSRAGRWGGEGNHRVSILHREMREGFREKVTFETCRFGGDRFMKHELPGTG